MKQKSLTVNAILNAIKQCCAIIFPLITFPYISRTLGKEGFGIYSFSLSVTNYFMLFAALGISTYAIREGARIRNDYKKIKKFASQIFTINLISASISIFFLILVTLTNSTLNRYSAYIFILGWAIVVDTLGTDWVNSIYEDYLYITVRYIAVEAIAIVLMFLFVHTSNDVAVYCWIALFAAHGGNFINIFYVRKYVRIRPTIHPNIKKHILPLLVLFINTLAVTIYVNADITMLGFYSNDSVVGIYSFSSRIYNILKSLINAIVVVSLPRISYILENESEQFEQYANKIFGMLTFSIFPIVVGLFAMSDSIIGIVGGDSYLSGAISLKILSFAIIFAIYSSFFSNCFLIVNNLEKECLMATVASSVANVVLNIFFLPKFVMNGAAITTLIAELINFLIQGFYSSKVHKLNFLRFRDLISCIVGSIGILFICIFLNLKIVTYWRIIPAVLVSALVYFIITFFMKNYCARQIGKTLLRVLKGKKH